MRDARFLPTQAVEVTSPISRTRGFLFADLRGYSAYTDRHGDRAAEALIGRYRRLVRMHIAAFQGAEIRTEGDSFYVVFDSVADAVEAALAISDAARATSDDGGPIPVGIGVHAGESRDGEHGIVSSAVNVAARVCSVAPAGQVLVTETVRSLVRTALPVRFTPVGRRRLKGIADPVQLFVVSPGAGEGDHVSATPGIWRTKRRYVVSLLGALLLAVGGIGAAVWLSAGAPPERTASTDRATPGSSTPSASATPQPLDKGSLSAGTYATAEFEPAFTFSVGDGWADAVDTPDDFYLVRVAIPRGAMGAFRTNVVFSGPCRDSPTQRIEGGSQSLLTWLEQHPYLESVNPRPRIVDGITGIQIDVTARELPEACPDGSRQVHLIPLAGTDGVSIAPDQAMRFVVADLPGGTVTFDFTAPTDFQQFLVEADAVLDTVDFVDPGG